MKSLFFFFLVSGVASASVPHKIVKVLDGTVATCAEKPDIFQHQYGAFRLSARGASLSGDHLRLRLKVEFFQCDQFGEEIGFVERGLTETYEQSVYTHSRGIEKTIVGTSSAMLTSTRDGIYNPEFKTQVNGSHVDVVVELGKLLRTEEYDALQSGEVVRLSLDTFLTKVITDSRVAGEALATFGSFRSHVELSRVNGTYKVRVR